MREAIRCFISCILPCGSLDVIRVVHLNGRVEEFSTSVRAGDVMRANPKHVLRRRTSDDGVVHRIIVLPPDAELQRGKIYFLVPVSEAQSKSNSSSSRQHHRVHRCHHHHKVHNHHHKRKTRQFLNNSTKANLPSTQFDSDRYLSDILSENVALSKNQQRGRVAIWRPRLESISEVSSDF